ncbi:crosslink repair DNA glycosylase YcaQ family protein [Actinoplanes sp. NPDC026619]|uniref:DNA glycosylase AlkZ-like family protein n=1 Tax=Actinoplanes sp. NPDC026619 TaxID=3155798 RepID=UPI0033D4E323
MGVHRLSRAEARRIAVRAQLLDAARPDGLLDLVHGLTLLQHDQTAAVAPNAHHIAWSRLGPAYSPADLTRALESRELLDLRGLIRPAGDMALHLAEMAAWPGDSSWRAAMLEWVRANDACHRDILRRLEAQGPTAAKQLPDTCVVPWKSTGWTNDRNVLQMLEIMIARGEVAVSSRLRGERQFDLAERVYPAMTAVPLEEARLLRNERRLGALGIARARAAETMIEPNGVGEAGEEAVIDGVRGKWRVDPAQLDQPFEGRVALLSPLDRLVYDRKRMVDLFEFDYQLEMYKPVAKRRWGYWALPILDGDRLVGKVDATADRKAGVLRVDAIHEDEPFDETEVVREIESLAEWLGLEAAGSIAV